MHAISCRGRRRCDGPPSASLNETLLAQGPREAPLPQTAEQHTAAPRRAIAGGSLLGIVVLVGLHVVGFIPSVGALLFFLSSVIWLGLVVRRLVLRAARQGRTGSPLRGLVLVLAALTIAALVLATLSGFQPNDWIVVAVPACALLVIWTADRLVSRYWAATAADAG